MNYGESGVRYDLLDPYKRAAMLAAARTAKYLSRFGIKELRQTRGESVYVVRLGDFFIGFAVEGVGTKNMVPQKLRQQLEIAHLMIRHMDTKRMFANVAICNAAAIFNDMATLGIRPVVFGQHLAVGESELLSDEAERQGYIEGTEEACHIVQCTWGCGETPTLKGIIMPGTVELSGASWGLCDPSCFFGGNIKVGDHIVIVPSSGVHENGLTLCRRIADSLSTGYLTFMSDGTTFGEALLQPTVLYSPLIEALQEAKVIVRYGINITGHGWRKLMRAVKPFTYVIDRVPKPQPVFDFIQERGHVSRRDMYGDFNMGGGFALIMPARSVKPAQVVGASLGHDLLDAGYVDKPVRGKKQVIIRPIAESYRELGVR